MFFQNFFFFLFSSLIFASAIMVVRSKNAVHSVLFLVLVFVNTTCLLLLSKVEFLAIILIIIYVGAIAILFLFVVMMLDVPTFSQNEQEIFSYLPIFVVISFTFFIETFLMIKDSFPISTSFIQKHLVFQKGYPQYILILDNILNIETLGQVLYSYYAFLFLLAGIVLLIALIGAVILTIQDKKKVISQEVFKQLSRNSKYAVLTFSH